MAKPLTQATVPEAAQAQGKVRSPKRARSSTAKAQRRRNPRVKRTPAERAIVARNPKDTAGLSIEQLLEVYQLLFETRRLEEHLVALYRQGHVIGGVYRSLGQEATAVGCAYALRAGDIIQPLIRDLGASLTHGVMPIALFRQYMAKATGPSGGRDLNVHFSDPSVGILGPISMLGAMVPVLAGTLLAARLKGQTRCGLAFIGDGGSSTGAFFEGLNFAAVQKLPMVMVIEANGYAYSTPTAAQLPDGDLLCRAKGFGISVEEVDGNDVLACFEATQRARERGLAGAGPSIVIAHTYRRKGHAEHDNQAYVPDGEAEDWATSNDPLERYNTFLTSGGFANDAVLNDIEKSIETALQKAREQALQEPLPDPTTVTHHVFANDVHPKPQPPSNTWFRGSPTWRDRA